MQYFIGIALPNDLKERVVSFQKGFASNKVPDIAEPHITVKAQGGLTEDESWIEAIRESVKRYPSFDVSLIGIAGFGDSVLFLSPTPSHELIGLHKLLVDVVRPSKELVEKYFEDETYQPHITLGGTPWGMSKDELRSMTEVAEKEFSDQESFVVHFIRIYRQRDLSGGYEKLVDLPFGS
jgi:2'-5' RNA ligase